MSFYLATFLAAFRLTPYTQWAALVSVSIATAATIAIWGRWNLGLIVPARLAARELFLGSLFAGALIGVADVIIVATTGLSHYLGNGVPWFELVTVFVPAVLHEELLFRGYAFQRLWRWKRWVGLWIGSGVFAAMHAGNSAVTPLALLNVFLGGLILTLAYERYERLWFPIGLHFAWNLMSGPILGYEVSGYAADATLLRTIGTGPAILTGGAFGIEGSVIMTVVELGAVAILWKTNAECRMQNEE